MAVAGKMIEFIENSSWIRKMFEEGTRLKAIHGSEKVYDFSLGNPNVPPPEIVKEKLIQIVQRDEPGKHGYMSNAGLLSTRSAISASLCREHRVSMAADHIVVTCGLPGP